MTKHGLLSLIAILASASLAACGGGGDDQTSGSGGAGTSSGTGGTCGLDCAGTGGGTTTTPKGTLVILPADVMLDVAPGMVPTQAFTATLEGQDVTASVVWYFDRPDMGDIDAAGLFTPTGNAGGTGKLTAQTANAEGSTTITVTATKIVHDPGVTPAQEAALDSPAGPPDPSMQLVYPYDETVFPLGVLSPEIQWNGADAADVYRLHFKEKFFEYTEYFAAPPPSRHIVAQAQWDAIERSGAGAKSDPLSVSLTRLPGSGVANQPVVQTWHVAQGRLHGSVYYWELPDQCGTGNGRILRIKPDSEKVDEFFQPGECWGCHTVSRDGRSMMAAFNVAMPGVPQALRTIDLTKTPPSYGAITGDGLVGTFSAYNGAGDKVLVSNDNQTDPSVVKMSILSPEDGKVLNPDAMGAGCGEPAWSPDSKKIAAICKLGGGGPWTFNAKQGELMTADIAADGFSVSNKFTIVPQAGQQGRPSFPSFSPDSQWVAFARTTEGATSQGFGNLWVIRPDGGNIRELKIAAPENRSYYPVFAPLRAGGYFWLVFISKRDYGNTLVGASRQQLWITAIDDPPLTPDPSHPAFYMRGQEACGKSESAYYALDPCKPIGAGCVSGVDCCNGTCVKDKDGNYVCGDPPPPGACVEDGNACKTGADCCNPDAVCEDGFCTPPAPN